MSSRSEVTNERIYPLCIENRVCLVPLAWNINGPMAKSYSAVGVIPFCWYLSWSLHGTYHSSVRNAMLHFQRRNLLDHSDKPEIIVRWVKTRNYKEPTKVRSICHHKHLWYACLFQVDCMSSKIVFQTSKTSLAMILQRCFMTPWCLIA